MKLLSMKSCRISLMALAVFAICSFSDAKADDWGNLSGRFDFDGQAPQPIKLDVSKELYCTKAEPPVVTESIVVGPDGGMANVFIWVRKIDPAKIHPDYAKSANDTVLLDNSKCRFEPHALGMRTGQTLQIKNSDPMGHNTNVALTDGAFNRIIPAGTTSDQKVESPETVPVEVKCNIHEWMSGRLLVRPDPYFAISDKSGKFEIKNLPAGTELEFQVWQEKSGYVEKASMGGKDAGWKRGRFKYTIKPGNNDLGEIKLDPAQFNK
jgi:hypothetical protein